MPAPRTGGLYKTCYPQFRAGFVEAVPSRAFRDGTGTSQIKLPPKFLLDCPQPLDAEFAAMS